MHCEVSHVGRGSDWGGQLKASEPPFLKFCRDSGLEGGSAPQGVPRRAQDRMMYGEEGYTHRVPPGLEGQGFPILPPCDCGLWVAPGRPTLQGHLLTHRGHCVPWMDLEILPKD